MTKRLILERKPSRDGATEGYLTFNSMTMCTIERPWIPGAPGGTPFESCIPSGVYKLRKHLRPGPRAAVVVALVNPALGVYYNQEDRPNGVGRYLILMHVANWAKDVVGCIGPGLSRADKPTDGHPMVTSSSPAMASIMKYVMAHDGSVDAEIEIRWII